MCLSTPKIPPPPPPPSEAKKPDDMAARRRARQPVGMGGTLLTGPGGITGGTNTAGTTLLGG